MNFYLAKAKIKAAAVHAIASLILAGICGGLVFYVWFPGQLSNMLRGTEMYWLVLLVEVILGPCMSLVIYNPSKSLAGLFRDYGVIVCVQFAALGYGLYVVAQSRPVYVVFVKDAFEVVTSLELDKKDLDEASSPEFEKVSWIGSKEVCSESPQDSKEKSDLLFSALEGRDIQVFPKYYRFCSEGEVNKAFLSSERLYSIIAQNVSYEHFKKQLPVGGFYWLPVKHRFGAGIRIYPLGNMESYYLPLDPYS